MEEPRWEFFPLLAEQEQPRKWLQIQANLGLAENTIQAYGKSLEDYLLFCKIYKVAPELAKKLDIANYVRYLAIHPNPRGKNVVALDSGVGLANATMQLRITAVRLFYDHLIEESIRQDNPVGRGKYTPGKGFAGHRDRALIPRYRKLPWIPNGEQWQAILEATKSEPLRNRVMLAMAYDAALRREELCSIEIGDIDPAFRLITIRAEITKNRQARVVPYSEHTGVLYANYLKHRRNLSREKAGIFLSESRRNKGSPITLSTWSKVVERIAKNSGIKRFTTHTLRHLCLTDLAKAGWDLHEIAQFAGHRSLETTKIYIHLSGRDLAEKLEQGMNQIHAWRIAMMAEILK